MEYEHDLLGFLLDALDPDEFRRIEQMLDADATIVEQLQTLRLGFVALEGACSEIELPLELARETCRRIREIASGTTGLRPET